LYPGPGSYLYDKFNDGSNKNIKFSKDLRFKKGDNNDPGIVL